MEERVNAQIDILLSGGIPDVSVFNVYKRQFPKRAGEYALMAKIAQRASGKKNGNGKAKATAE